MSYCKEQFASRCRRKIDWSNFKCRTKEIVLAKNVPNHDTFTYANICLITIGSLGYKFGLRSAQIADQSNRR